MSKKRLTEQQFIEKFKKEGFELYKSENIIPKLNIFYALIDLLKPAK